MSFSKALGGVLLIVGTSIGAGMLALPLALSQVGFWPGLLMLVLCWAVMYTGASMMLEANLAFPPGSHMVTMAKNSLGRIGGMLAWISSLCLLYTLLAAYIAGGSDVLQGVVDSFIHLPHVSFTLLFTLVLGWVVYAGVRFVDYSNRLLMFAKLAVYLCVVLLVFPHIQVAHLQGSDWSAAPKSIMILITSFGFASIVPSLRFYFQDDIPLLRRVIFIGSVIPLFCYIAWNAVMMGVFKRGELIAISQETYPITGLTVALETAFHSHIIAGCFSAFTAICMFTAFLGVSLGLYDFLADGLQLKKRGIQGFLLFCVTFFPPMLVVLLCQEYTCML